ncbi:MoaD/ThiS family protein [Haliangium ochraceum]|uniref:ThiamineS n=1 Tax=Haliangium ochraceum (strain DSM 14365 / JCM 11303 / SMP-2) TaxID=502025 RepID=D0LNQ2_HALO1|nr:MoaD/ThiS family protein [Haliangium ochraceum]ACY16957.1 thiamineS [Haliangium ochraceum DSM 14365]
MPTVAFTKHLQRHVSCPSLSAEGDTVRTVLEAVFAANPQARSYVLDEQGALRKHMVVFIDGRQIQDRIHLGDSVSPTSELYIMQALSGG